MRRHEPLAAIPALELVDSPRVKTRVYALDAHDQTNKTYCSTVGCSNPADRAGRRCDPCQQATRNRR